MKGYQQAIAETDEINLVGTGMVKPEEFSIATCTRITEDLLQAHPSAKVILGFCGYVIPGAVTAMETFNRQDVIVVDVDGMPEETSLIESGEAAQCATMGQYPYDFGVKGVEIFLQYRADPSAEFPEFTAVDTMLVTKDNVTEFDGFSRLAQ
jgi:ribose transport system substrate-binding protein